MDFKTFAAASAYLSAHVDFLQSDSIAAVRLGDGSLAVRYSASGECYLAKLTDLAAQGSTRARQPAAPNFTPSSFAKEEFEAIVKSTGWFVQNIETDYGVVAERPW
ncbi:hypothetical protein J4441_03390 [Candidatus Micrarchaeota archaeon]|nr:hypothetical protein [Candidatus Micrarchaeota archaeon]